ncbi:MAG: AraC family transcriptional activator of pobA [Crocinitomix sp.]|jgi:AraC family transcriptional activator of pobA
MTNEFKEFSTEALLRIGDEELMLPYKDGKQIGLYTFIQATDIMVEIIVDGELLVICPNHIMSLTPIQMVTFLGGQNLIVHQFNREFYCIKDHDKEVSCMGILFFGNNFTPILKLTDEELIKFTQLHSVIKEEMETRDNVQAEMLRMLLKRYIIKATRLVKEQEHLVQEYSPKLELLRQYNILVESHFKNQHQVVFYADQLNKSPKTLSNIFREYNTAPLKIIQNRLILEAKRLLSYSDLSQKEVAYELGFEDASHFSRFFKNKVSMSPSMFKNSKKGKIGMS